MQDFQVAHSLVLGQLVCSEEQRGCRLDDAASHPGHAKFLELAVAVRVDNVGCRGQAVESLCGVL